MNKKRNLFLGSLILISSSLSILACGAKHEFNEKWTYDETSHWHACLTEGHEDTKDKADHDFNEWQVKTPAGVHVDRVETRTCKTCNYVDQRTIANTGYHSFSKDWDYDSEQHWHCCTYEGCDVKNDVARHSTTLVEEVPATCTTNGVASHRVCDCGALFDLNFALITDPNTLVLAKDANKHTYSAWIEQVDANCANETNGTKGHYDCTLCGKHFDANKNELTNLTIAWAHDLYMASYSNTLHMGKCRVCNKFINSTKEAHTKVLQHDDNNHWYYCSVCDTKFDQAAHTFEITSSTAADYGVAGSTTETCSVCGYVKTTSIPALTAKDRTITYDGETSATYTGESFDSIFSNYDKAGTTTSNIKITTTSTATNKTLINSGFTQPKIYSDEACTNELTTLPKDVGEYYVKYRLLATAEWLYAETVVKFTINPIVVATFTPGEVIQVKSGNISSDGSFTFAENTSVDGQTVKAVAKLNLYNGEGSYSLVSSMITIVDGDGSSTTDYLKNYIIKDNSTSENYKVHVQVYNELLNSFTISEVVSCSSDASSGKNITTFEVKPSIASGKSVSLTVGAKLLMDLANRYVTITKIKIGNDEFTEAGTTKIIYSSYTSSTFTATVLGGYLSNYILSRTFTQHSHNFNKTTGTCACGETYAQEVVFKNTETNLLTTLQVVDHKAYFNFNYCGSRSGNCEVRVQGDETNGNPVESIDIYLYNSTKVGTFSSLSAYEYWYNNELSNSKTLLTANTQYYVVITLKEICAYDELNVMLYPLCHRYNNDVCDYCGGVQ